MNKFLVTLKIQMAIILTDQSHKKFDDLDRDKIINELPSEARSYLQSKTEEQIESAFLVGWLEAKEYHGEMKPKQPRLL